MVQLGLNTLAAALCLLAVYQVYREPQGPGVRVDAGVVEGSEVLVHYDPLLSKVITWGHTREAAAERLRTALDTYVVHGVATNIPFLRHMLDVPDFKQGDYSTDFIQSHYGEPREPGSRGPCH